MCYCAMPCPLHLLAKARGSFQKTNNTFYIRDLGRMEREDAERWWTLDPESWAGGDLKRPSRMRQSLCYVHPCTCTNHSRVVAREGLEGASGVCILVHLAGTWRNPGCSCIFVKEPHLDNIWMSRVSPAACWETWFLRRKQRWKEGSWFPQWSRTFSPLVADEDEQQLLGFFHGKRFLCGEGVRRPWG